LHKAEETVAKEKAKRAETVPEKSLPDGVISVAREKGTNRILVYTRARIVTPDQQRWARRMQRDEGVTVHFEKSDG
jgi:hypothetical protein